MNSISVIMSVYKSEKPEYLHRSLQSVWDEQTCRPQQIILIADGPLTEELDAVLAAWTEKLQDKLTICRNEVNLGLTKSLNKGLRHTTGEYIARMDSDDISHPQRFEIQTRFLAEHPDIAVVGGSIQEFNDSAECLNVRHYPTDPDAIRKYICKASPLAHPNVMMRREIFDSGITYDERYRTSQDIALWYDVLEKGYRITNVDEVTLYFRLADDVFNRRSRQKAMNEFKIYMRGIYRLHGVFTLAYAYPISRLVFRLLPKSLIKWIYNSPLRQGILSK